MMRLALGICFALAAGGAWAATPPLGSTPFSCHASTAIPYPADVIFNPPPGHVPGLIGECAALPYQVPAGYQLVIDAIHLEAVWGAGLIVMIGNLPADDYEMTTLATASGNIGQWLLAKPSNQYNDLNWHFVAGTMINIRLSGNPGQSGIYYNWDISGWLVPSP